MKQTCISLSVFILGVFTHSMVNAQKVNLPSNDSIGTKMERIVSGTEAEGFVKNGNTLYYRGNVGIGTNYADQRLTIVGGNIKVTGALAPLNEPSHTYISLINKGIRGGLHDWKIFTSSSAGAWGIGPNAFEIWEYPQLSNSVIATGLDVRRFAIQTNRDRNGCSPVIIGPKGGLHIGYVSNYVAEDYNMLSVNGNVGIGTSNTKGYKLAVNGVIKAKEIRVESTGWADFVFKKDYKLPALNEVKQHIKENGTLPGIPNEADAKANGVNVGEMNVLLLQKIEELTLYVIKQQEEINELKKQLKQ